MYYESCAWNNIFLPPNKFWNSDFVKELDSFNSRNTCEEKHRCHLLALQTFWNSKIYWLQTHWIIKILILRLFMIRDTVCVFGLSSELYEVVRFDQTDVLYPIKWTFFRCLWSHFRNDLKLIRYSIPAGLFQTLFRWSGKRFTVNLRITNARNLTGEKSF